MKALFLTVFLLAPLFAAPTRLAENEPRFALGVLRRDGVVLPFASFTGKGWESRWPDDLRFTELPLLLGDVPARWWGKAGPATGMTLWRDGAARGTLDLQRPVMITPACDRRIGLTSTYTSSEIPPPPFVRPYPKEGLVTSGPQPIQALEAVKPGTRDFIGAALTLVEPMERAEEVAINQFTAWRHPYTKKDRRKIPLEIEALYRAPMDEPGWIAYHVEAVKRYPPEPDDEGCGLIASASGWMAVGPKGKTWTEIGARVTYCDRRGVVYFMPLGLMRLAGKTYWIFQTAGYEAEFYGIVRPTSKAVEGEVGYTAGTCRAR